MILLPAKVSIHLENKHFTSRIYKLSVLANRPLTRSPANESDWLTRLGKFNLKSRCCQHLRFGFGLLTVVTWLVLWQTESSAWLFLGYGILYYTMDSPQRVLTPIPASSPSSMPLNMHARMGPGPIADIPSEPGTILTFILLYYNIIIMTNIMAK